MVLQHSPQTEKEQRTSPAYRFAKLDVWTKDMDDAIYDTEVQGKNTKNLPKRSRFYQSMIDSKLLEPGEKDFNKMNDVYIILIAPFDLFGEGKYMYTFQMTCQESFSVLLNDGATRIFLNTAWNESRRREPGTGGIASLHRKYNSGSGRFLHKS